MIPHLRINLRWSCRNVATIARVSGWIIGVVGFFAMAACVETLILGVGGKVMRVELDVFSGRPNPSWDLTSQEEQEFLSRLRSLPTGAGSGTIADKLGYRGVIVTAGNQTIDGFDEIVASEGIVLGRQASSVQMFTDKGRALERWLLDTGKQHLAPDLYGAISKEF